LEGGTDTTIPVVEGQKVKTFKVDLEEDGDHSEMESKVARSSQMLQKPFDLGGFTPIVATPLERIEEHKELIQKSRVQTVGPLFQSL